jgi:hypothetical protein
MKGYYLKANSESRSDEKYCTFFYSRKFSTYLPIVIDGVRIIKGKKTGKHYESDYEYCIPKRCLKTGFLMKKTPHILAPS